MRKKMNTGTGEAVQTTTSKAYSSQPSKPSPKEAVASSPLVDFLSPEFNVVDDLDDNIGNYRTFQSLEGIVTSDMRHHEERKRLELSPQDNEDMSIEDNGEENLTNETADQGLALPLTIVSKGRTLIIDSDIENALKYGKLLNEQGLTCTLCVPTNTKNDLSFSRSGFLTVINTDSISVRGSFGGFTATTATNDKQTKLSTLLGDEVDFFDLVLDLQSPPSFNGKLLPVGYYAPGKKPAGIYEALDELPKMRGRFTKPQFTVFLEKNCIHGRSRLHNCRRCLDICPVDAITSVGSKIAFNPYLCQGCGGCALVCPVDAVFMQSPSQEDLLSTIAELLSDAATYTKTSPELVLYDLNIDSKTLYKPADETKPDRLFFGVEEIGRISMEVLLVALACGAGKVTLICDPERPASIKKALEQEVKLTRIILQGLNFSADRIQFIISPSVEHDDFSNNAEPSEPGHPLIPPVVFSFAQDRRTLTRLTAHHLAKVSDVKQAFVSLPADAPFGTIAIDAAACSLCMACVGSCPSGALKTSGEEPCISFVESLCHQCGLCREACPENAIKIQSRLLLNNEAAEAPTILRKVEPFNCIECGTPFASLAMINRMQEKLSGHWMYSNDQQVRRLKMCRTCRTRDALTTGDYRQ